MFLFLSPSFRCVRILLHICHACVCLACNAMPFVRLPLPSWPLCLLTTDALPHLSPQYDPPFFCLFFFLSLSLLSLCLYLQQQLQAQHLSQHAAQALPMAPHPSGLPHPGLALGGSSGLLALSGALGAQLGAKDERAHLEAVAAAAAAAAAEHHRGTSQSYIISPEF